MLLNNIDKYKLKITPVLSQKISTVSYGVFSSPIGSLILFSTSNHLCGVYPLKLSIIEHIKIVQNKFKSALFIHEQELIEKWANSLFSTKKTTPLFLAGTPFQKSVWSALLTIPAGTTVAYKDIALAIKKPYSFRATANAIGQNPIFYFIPCHRVISSSGKIGGFRWGVSEKKSILKQESLLMRDLCIKK